MEKANGSILLRLGLLLREVLLKLFPGDISTGKQVLKDDVPGPFAEEVEVARV